MTPEDLGRAGLDELGQKWKWRCPLTTGSEGTALDKLRRVVYGLFGILYVLIGAGSMLLPTGWLPKSPADDLMEGEIPSPFVGHILQEFGTVLLALGLVLLWYSSRKVPNRSFHWAITFYFALDALIHWVGPQGLIGSWPRGIINSIPFAVMLLLGLLELREAEEPEGQR